MKSLILALGTVLVLGCVEQPSSPSVSKPPRATVLDELAAAVKGRWLPRASRMTGWHNSASRSSGLFRG